MTTPAPPADKKEKVDPVLADILATRASPSPVRRKLSDNYSMTTPAPPADKKEKVDPVLAAILATRYKLTSKLLATSYVHPEAGPDCQSGFTWSCASQEECVFQHQRCDGYSDCGDGSDEQDCQCDSGAHFTCADGDCLLRALHCDGVDDCQDYSDEWNCECPVDFWYCASERRCMPDHFRCDTFVDCSDPSDEQDCATCEAGEFSCRNDECVATSVVCDVRNDCTDGSDEVTCLYYDDAHSPVVREPGDADGEGYYICMPDYENVTDHIADLTCRELGYDSGSTDVLIENVIGPSGVKVMVAADDISKTIRLGASFYDASSFTTACPSGRIMTGLTCAHPACGTPTLNPDGSTHNIVVNGDYAQIESWPWQVSVHRYGQHSCGGSIINREWILTAAHCIVEPMSIVVGSTSNEAPIFLTPRRTVIHPKYTELDRSNVGYFGAFNDVALIQLYSPLSWSDTVQPVCRPHAGQDLSSYSRCYITGWGQYQPEYGGNAPTHLKQGKVDIIPVSSCQNWYYERWQELFSFRLPYQAPIRESNHICLGNQEHGGVSACYGDSGGPLSCQSSVNGAWYLQGVASTVGVLSCDRHSIYENVLTHNEWIDDVMAAYSIYS